MYMRQILHEYIHIYTYNTIIQIYSHNKPSDTVYIQYTILFYVHLVLYTKLTLCITYNMYNINSNIHMCIL